MAQIAAGIEAYRESIVDRIMGKCLEEMNHGLDVGIRVAIKTKIVAILQLINARAR